MPWWWNTGNTDNDNNNDDDKDPRDHLKNFFKDMNMNMNVSQVFLFLKIQIFDYKRQALQAVLMIKMIMSI